MAKRIQFKRVQQTSRVSGGSIFRTFPGSGGSFSAETPDITDTVLGQTYESTERGLIDWRVSTNGIYNGYPGFRCRIARGGAATDFADDATVALSGNPVMRRIDGKSTAVYGYTAKNPAERLFDRHTEMSLSGDANIVEIDYLGGVIYVDAAVSSPTISGKYRPVLPLARATDYTLTLSTAMRDESNFVESDITGKDALSAEVAVTNTVVRLRSRAGLAGNVKIVFDSATAAATTVTKTSEKGATTQTYTIKPNNTSGSETNTVASFRNWLLTNTGNAAKTLRETLRLSLEIVSGDGTDELGTETFTLEGGTGYAAPIKLEDPDARGGYMLYSPGLRTTALSLSGVTIPERVLSDVLNFRTALQEREELIVEINPDGLGIGTEASKGVGFRAWMRLASASEEGDVGQTQTTSLEFTAAVPHEALIQQVFSLSGNVSRLPGAVLDALDSWLSEEYQNEVRYLPTGVVGSGTGVQGKVIISDLSLSGGLTSMNIFNVEMMGNGKYTEV